MKYFPPSEMLAQNNREYSEESESGEDSDMNGLSHEMESDEGGADNELHVKIIGFMVTSLYKESNR